MKPLGFGGGKPGAAAAAGGPLGCLGAGTRAHKWGSTASVTCSMQRACSFWLQVKTTTLSTNFEDTRSTSWLLHSPARPL